MQREIRFRAWLKDPKTSGLPQKMYYNCGISFGDCGMSVELKRPMAASKDWWPTHPAEFFEVMQFTGLKDRHGKPIFEGDVLEILEENDSDHGFYVPLGEKIVVDWIDDGFYLVPVCRWKEIVDSRNSDGGICDKCLSYQGLFSENHEIDIGFFSQVLGNIYEHPDLLEKV